MGDQVNNQRQVQPQTRSGTSFSRDVVNSAPLPPPISSTLPGDQNPVRGQESGGIIDTLRGRWGDVVSRGEQINRDYIQPALREGQEWMDWIVDKGWEVLDTVMPDSITPDALQNMMTSRYGMRDHPILGGRRPHKGDDIRCPSGTPIQALANGRVIYQHDWGRTGFGRYMAVDYGNGVIGGYGHLSRFSANAGEFIERGQTFGLSGSTGGSTGPHLHEEMYVWSPTDRTFYCCKPEEVRAAMASNGLRTDQQKEDFITQTANTHWGGSRESMRSGVSDALVGNVDRYGFTPLESDRVIANNTPTGLTPVG